MLCYRVYNNHEFKEEYTEPYMSTSSSVVNTAPECPQCGMPMKMRTARRGPRAGGQFWGCVQYPRCRGTRDISENIEAKRNENVKENPAESDSNLKKFPVRWDERHERANFISAYEPVGSIPGVFRDSLIGASEVETALGQCLLLRRESSDKNKVPDYIHLASRLLIKILQRGKAPPPTIGVERAALRAHGLLEKVHDLADEGVEVGWCDSDAQLRVTPEDILSAYVDKKPFILGHEFISDTGSNKPLFDSETENQFLTQWVPKELGKTAGHWFTPQASLGNLLGKDDDQRVDFLFYYPGSEPIVIEIDGPEHEAARQVDRSRDEQLKSAGIEVFRVPNEEVNRGQGSALSQIREKCKQAFDRIPTEKKKSKIAFSIIDCTIATKIQFAVAHAMKDGKLTPDRNWNIEITGAREVAAAGILDILKLLTSLDTLYGGKSVPEQCTVKADDDFAVSWVLEDDEWKVSGPTKKSSRTLHIVVDFQSSPFHRLAYDVQPDFIICSAYLPVNLAVYHAVANLTRRTISQSNYDDKSREALTVFLQNIFRKYEFNDKQGEAIHNVLCQNDSIVLLPTGAGKSLIYQLAGLLMPGITLGVYPLVALIEDQFEGLSTHGIDRAIPIAQSISPTRGYKDFLSRVDYQFILITPERMQTSEFREALLALAGKSLINLAVVDEAHCVSEWGHDFRPAYLNLADNLRLFCEDKESKPPPILALTGTASRTVLRDTLTELGIDQSKSNALIRPESFNRPELSFEVVRTKSTSSPKAVLEGVLRSLPDKWNLPPEKFYRPRGWKTMSGIVFVPTVKDRLFGIYGALQIVKQVTGAEIAIYSGTPPAGYEKKGWDGEKQKNAREFKQNKAPVLVSTKAFGMGIDKSNIRYIVHFGMPSSLESFYQEVGRAGRDRKPAHCIVVFSEYDSERSAELLDSSLDSLHPKLDSLSLDNRDDVTRALYFHCQAFEGVSQEIHYIEKALDDIGDLSSRRTIPLPFWNKESRQKAGNDVSKVQEKAIYKLLRIGILKDYRAEYGSRKFILDVRKFDPGYCKKRLREYIHVAQPAMSRKYDRKMSEINEDTPQEITLALARLLIEFTYEVIEGARRRMIEEAMRLARQANSDEDIRSSLLYYLQEGLNSESISDLLKDESIDLFKWFEFIDKAQTPIEAGELRGFCIRELESYPTHPGLLLARAIAESMCSDYDYNVCRQGIKDGISQSREYEVENPLMEVTAKIFNFARGRAPELGPPLTSALLDLSDNSSSFPLKASEILALTNGLEDKRVRALATIRKAHDIFTLGEKAINLLNAQQATAVTEQN